MFCSPIVANPEGGFVKWGEDLRYGHSRFSRGFIVGVSEVMECYEKTLFEGREKISV
jgi:hypothetical protein